MKPARRDYHMKLMMKNRKKTAFFGLKLKLFLAVLNLSYIRPKPVLYLPQICPLLLFQECNTPVLNLSYIRPKPILNLSARNRKKRTTPFGGMARPYYSLATPLFHSLFSLSLLPYLLSLFPPKFSMECIL